MKYVLYSSFFLCCAIFLSLTFFGSVQCSGKIHSVVQVSCFSQSCNFSQFFRAAHFFRLWCGFSLIISKVNFLIQWIKVKFIPGMQFFVLSKFVHSVSFSCSEKILICGGFHAQLHTCEWKTFSEWKLYITRRKNCKFVILWVCHVVQICAFCEFFFS